MRVLVVCTGNICRSPLAERLAAEYAAGRQIGDFQPSSAGIRAVIGHSMHPESAKVLGRLGGDPSDFSARQLTAKIASSADLILTMTRAHRDAVLELAPAKLHRTFTLAEASRLVSEHGAQTIADLSAKRSLLTADDTLDIPDPIGQSAAIFAEIGSRIAHLLPPVLEVCQQH